MNEAHKAGKSDKRVSEDNDWHNVKGNLKMEGNNDTQWRNRIAMTKESYTEKGEMTKKDTHIQGN